MAGRRREREREREIYTTGHTTYITRKSMLGKLGRGGAPLVLPLGQALFQFEPRTLSGRRNQASVSKRG